MRRALLLSVVVVTLAGALPAAATGTLDCVADADGVKVSVHGVVPYSGAAPLLQVEAAIEAPLPDVGADLASMTFTSEHNPQYWFNGEVMNVMFYRERLEGDFGSTKLTIETKRIPDTDEQEGVFHGTYEIESYDVPASGDTLSGHLSGAIECFVG